MNRLSFFLLLLGACASLVVAASAPTFCKCTCFTNSTIIEIKSTTPNPLTGSHLVDDPPLPPSDSSSPPDIVSSEPTVPETTPADTQNRLVPRAPKRAAASSPSCSQCNRKFCLEQTLPICKDATDKDVATMCFQRDSRKDQIIVWGFILGTAGLLGWAAVRKALEVRKSGGGLAGALLGGDGGAVSVGRVGGGGGRSPGFMGAASGSDGGLRGQYVGVAGHSRESSLAG